MNFFFNDHISKLLKFFHYADIYRINKYIGINLMGMCEKIHMLSRIFDRVSHRMTPGHPMRNTEEP